MDQAQRVLRARIAGLTRAATWDGREVTASAREAFLRTFLAQVDRDFPGLPEAERERRAVALRRLHFVRLAYQSARARAERRGSAESPGQVARLERAPEVPAPGAHEERRRARRSPREA